MKGTPQLTPLLAEEGGRAKRCGVVRVAGASQKRISKDAVTSHHPDRALRGHPSSRGGESLPANF